MISSSVDPFWNLSKQASVLGAYLRVVEGRGRTEVCALNLLFPTFGLFSCLRPSRSSSHLSKFYLWILNTLDLCAITYIHLTLDLLQFGAYLFFSDENINRNYHQIFV